MRRRGGRAALGGALSLACLAGQAAGQPCVRPTVAGYNLNAVVETDLRRTDSVPESCDAAAVTDPPTDCVTGYTPGTAAARSTTCPAGCTLTDASNFDVDESSIVCATGYGDGSGGAGTPTVSECTAGGQPYQLSGCLRQPECLSIVGADPTTHVGYDVSGVAETDRLRASFLVTGVQCATGYHPLEVLVETCVAAPPACTSTAGYVQGSAAAPSTTCPDDCTFTPAGFNPRAVKCAADDQAYTFAGCTANVCQTPQSAVPWDEPPGYEGRATCTSTTTGSISCTFDDPTCSAGYNGRFGIDSSSGIDYTNREITCDTHALPLTFGGCHADCPTGTSTAAGALALPPNGVYSGCGTAAGGTAIAMAEHLASCALDCATGYTLNPAGAQAVCTDGQIAHSATCVPNDCVLTKPSFGDWGTCDDDPALIIDPLSRVTLPHGTSCTIECAAGYIGRPRDLVQSCTAGTLSSLECVEAQPCDLTPTADGGALVANATWGSCTNLHPTLSNARQLDHGDSCAIGCEPAFNVSTGAGFDSVLCDDGSLVHNMSCIFTHPPEPEPEPSYWHEEGNWVSGVWVPDRVAVFGPAYDPEGTLETLCSDGGGKGFCYAAPNNGPRPCPDGDTIDDAIRTEYNSGCCAVFDEEKPDSCTEVYNMRTGEGCVWDPDDEIEYLHAAGVNYTLLWSKSEMEAIWETHADFEVAFRQEMGDLLQITHDRIKVFRTYRDNGECGDGDPQDDGDCAVHRTVVEFIIRIECRFDNSDGDGANYDAPAGDAQAGHQLGHCLTDEGESCSPVCDPKRHRLIGGPAPSEPDPTQAAKRLIEYYHEADSILYKYTHSQILSKTCGPNSVQCPGIDVVATCGQDPCVPRHTGFLPMIVTICFLLASCIACCCIMSIGRGALAKYANT